MTAPAAAPVTPGRPATTRVTVLVGRRMTDLVLPSAVPIEEYVDETVTVLGELLSDAPADVLAGFDFAAQGTWAFARPGAPPLAASTSLDGAGIVDGALLTLVPVSRTERYRPLVEDVIDAIAVLDEAPRFDRRALNDAVAVSIPVAATVVTAMAVFGWARTGHGVGWPLAIGSLGVGLLVASVLADRRYRSTRTAESLLVAAFAPLGGAAALAVPLPAGVTGLGAPNAAGAAVMVLLLVLLTRGGPGRRAEVASFVAVAAVAMTAAAVADGYGWQAWVPVGAVAVGMAVVTNAAKLTVAVARIALPPVPAPGEVIANDELLEAIQTDGGADEETPTWQAIMASVPVSAVRLTERGHLARQLLVGFVSAGALVLAAGAVGVVHPGHFFVHGLVVAGLVTLVCGFRARLYAERCCAWALLAAALIVPTGVVIRSCVWFPHRAWLVLGMYVAIAAVAVLVVGATGGVRRVSPVSKRLLELVDGASIAAVIPILLWIAGVYDQLRNVRF